eukprot:m.35524 g.35524  ORF g.35524 m.35524 type:complete len:327 (+) comp10931_c0_seq2:8205-9185(+)
MAASATFALLIACSLASVLAKYHDARGFVYYEHSLLPPYSADHPHWDMSGSTVTSESYIRLTPDRQSRWGLLWNKKVWSNKEAGLLKFPGFEVVLQFHVHGQGTKLFGDGFAFWYTKEIQEPGPVFGSADNFKGLGIFFDTYSNKQQGHQQYVSAMIGNGKTSYDHSQDGGDAKLAGCWFDFRSERAFAKIVYDERMLRVYLDTERGDGWEECFVIRRVFLPPSYFGLSAATGDLADNHDILTLKVSEPQPMSPNEKLELEQRIAKDEEDKVEQREHHDPQYEGMNEAEEMSILAVLVAVAVFVAIVALLFWYSQEQQRKARTHFT